MAHWRTKFAASFSLKRRTPPAVVPPLVSSHNIDQMAEALGAVSTVPLPSELPQTDSENIPANSVKNVHTPVETSAVSRTVLHWRTKFFPATARKRTPLDLPVHSSPPYIGPALLVSGLVIAAPVHTVSLPATAFESTPEGNIELSDAKSALRVLSALGDGMVGVPWLKGAAALGLEIVSTLDNVQSNKSECRDLALRICQFLVLVHQGSRTSHDHDPKHIAEFQRDLYRILRTVKTISSYKLYRRLLKADGIKQQIFKCNQMINHSRDIFLVGAHVALADLAAKHPRMAEIGSPHLGIKLSDVIQRTFFLEMMNGRTSRPAAWNLAPGLWPRPFSGIFD